MTANSTQCHEGVGHELAKNDNREVPRLFGRPFAYGPPQSFKKTLHSMDMWQYGSDTYLKM